MNDSSPTKLIFASLFLGFISLKLKEQCYYCFLGAFFAGILFLIFGIYKLIRQSNG